MAAKQKTSVRAGAKATNKSTTDKARKAAAAEIAERIERLDAAEAATTAPDAAEPTPPNPAKGKGRKSKAGPDAATGSAYADDGALQTVSIPAGEPEAKPAPRGRKPKQPKPEKVKKVSGLDAAALVLAESATPMKAVDMLAEIQKRGLWASKGRTPEATLYAAIIREIAAKGKDSRFKKHDRGLFIATVKEG
jgi:hypothetical protein